MAGPYRALLSRATVVEEGGAARSWKGVTFSVRDGVATIKDGGDTITMPATTVTRLARNSYQVEGDGLVWTVTRPCGCGSR